MFAAWSSSRPARTASRPMKQAATGLAETFSAPLTASMMVRAVAWAWAWAVGVSSTSTAWVWASAKSAVRAAR